MGKIVEDTENMVKELHQQVYGDAEKPMENAEDVVIEPVEQVPPTEDLTGVPAGEVKPDEDYKHKYDTLQGMYNADVPKLQQQIAFLQGMLADQAAPAQAPTVKNEGNEDVDFVQKEYPYVITAINAIVDQKFGLFHQSIMAEISSVIDSINGRMNDLGSVAGQTQSSLFWSRLSTLVPDWEALNTNQDFITWLTEADPFSGIKKLDLLQRAKAEYNADKVALFFSEYKKQKGITATPTKQPSQVERMVAPGRSTGSVGQTTKLTGDQPLTREDIANFYRDVKRGLYAGKDNEKQAMEKRIAQMAASFGRKG